MPFIHLLLMALAFLGIAAVFLYIGLNDPIPLFGREYRRPRIVRLLCLMLAGVLLGISLRIIWILPRINSI